MSIFKFQAVVRWWVVGWLCAAAMTGEAAPKVLLGYYNTDYASGFQSLTNYGAALNAVSTDTFLVNARGAVTGTAPLAVLAFAQAQKMAVYACISNEQFDPKIAHRSLTKSPTTLVTRLVQLALIHGYTGVNIDFEGLYPADRNAFSHFIQTLSEALHMQHLQLVISVPAEVTDDPKDNWSGAFDYAVLGQAADFIQVMTYDETVADSPPGPVAGLDWMTNCIAYAVTKIPPAKVLLGLPAYGRDWNVKSKQAVDFFWTDIPSLLATHHTTLSWDLVSASGFFNYTANRTQHQVWCETQAGLQLKCALVKQFNLGGVSFWALGMEDAAFRQAVSAGME